MHDNIDQKNQDSNLTLSCSRRHAPFISFNVAAIRAIRSRTYYPIAFAAGDVTELETLWSVTSLHVWADNIAMATAGKVPGQGQVPVRVANNLPQY